MKRTKRTKRMKQTKQTKRMKGGLGPYDSFEIHMPERYSFRNPTMIDEFKLYVFGSTEQRVAWETLLTECNNRGVPVYILSAGDKIGIIRMLQLMNLDHAFEEVLCTNPNEHTTPDEQPNPESDNGLHNFQGYTKYNVIRAILREKYNIPTESEPLTFFGVPFGCLMDDDKSMDIDIPGKHIVFENVKSVNVQTISDNMFYKFVVASGFNPHVKSRWFADVGVIYKVTELVINGTYKIVFIDFDRTFQQWPGAIPVYDTTFKSAFMVKFKVIER